MTSAPKIYARTVPQYHIANKALGKKDTYSMRQSVKALTTH